MHFCLNPAASIKTSNIFKKLIKLMTRLETHHKNAFIAQKNVAEEIQIIFKPLIFRVKR